MPEGPEVRIIGEDLAKKVSSRNIVSIEVLSGRYVKKSLPGLDHASSNVPLSIVGVGVHGKFIYWITRNDIFLYNTLGMTGRWSDKRSDHSRVAFHLSDGRAVYFEDQRNFGTLKFVVGRENLIKKLEGLGPDLLSGNVTNEEFISCVRKKKKWAICKALMDQSVVAGVGNYVKAEALWRSRISPHRAVSDMSDQDLNILKKCCQEVLHESYSSGGASIKTYVRPDGSAGQYNQRFAVYNQKVDPDGNNVVKEQTEDGRTTHWVPSIQI
jgi:formamidopyrimidine-DNA glycosylase